MTVKPKQFCITILYIFIIICAASYLRYAYIRTENLWKIYLFSQYIIVLLCLLYILFFGLKSLKRPIQLLPVLAILYVFYELIVSFFTKTMITPNIIIDVLPWPLVFLVFHNFSKSHELPVSFKPITTIGIIIICVLSVPNIFRRELTGTGIFATYYCLPMLALVYLIPNNRKESIFFSIIVAILMAFSLKRGGLIAAVIGIGIYYIMVAMIEEQNRKKVKKFTIITLTAIVLVVVGYYLIDVFDLDIVKRLEMMSSDGGSGRTKIWNLVINQYNYSSRIEQVFGHGFQAVYYQVRPYGISRFAHNSYIETIYDYGIVGLVILISLVIGIINNSIHNFKARNSFTPVMFFTIVVIFVLSSISYFFEQSIITTPVCVILGICTGRSAFLSGRKKKRNLNKL